MPQLIEVPGQGVVEFPDSMNDQQIAAAIKNNMGTQEAAAPKSKSISKVDRTDPTALKAFARGAVEGASNVGRGVEQLYFKGAEKLGIVPQGTGKNYIGKVEKQRAAYSELPYVKGNQGYATAGEIAGGLAPTLPFGAASIPLRAASAGKGFLNALTSNTARTLASNAGQGAAAGAVQYDPTGESRLANAASGATLGAALPAGAAIAGRLLKGKKGAGAAEMAALAKEQGIDLSVPELRGSVGGKYVESLMEKVPGTGYIGFREKQVGQFQKQAEKLTAEAGAKAGDDFGQTIKGSLKTRLKENKKEASEAFNKVDKLASQTNANVALNNTKQEAETILQELENIPEGFQNNALLQQVTRFIPLENPSFNVARKLRTQLGDEVSRLKKASNMGSASAEEYRMATRLFGALENDMDNFAEQAGGELKKAYGKARDIYKNKVVPFKKDQLAKVMADDYDTDLLIGGFLKPGREILASKLVKNLDKTGLQASRAAILNDAMEKASQGEKFNPLAFSKEALRLGKANKVVFAKDQLQSLEGYKKLAQAAERASNFAKNPETGARIAGLATVGLGGGGALLLDRQLGVDYQDTLAGIGAGILGARLLKSPLGAKLLTRAYHTPENAKPSAWRKILTDAAKLLGPVASARPSISEENNIQ